MILAFDLALGHFGWALISTDGRFSDKYGAVRCPFGAKAHNGVRYQWMSEELGTVIGQAKARDLKVDLWKEAPVRASFTVLKTQPIHGVFDLIAWRHGLVPREISPRSIKVLACNDGSERTTKKKMIEAAQTHLGFEPCPNWRIEQKGDAADALWVADFAARLQGARRPELPKGHLRALEGKR